MQNDKKYIGRKRTVFVEKTLSCNNFSKNGMLKRFGLPLFFSMDFLRKNRFVVEMQIDDEVISNDNVQGFLISNINDKEKTININTIIPINEWIHEYEKINIIKIYLLDGLGNELRQFDFDVIYKGYIFECDYREESLIIPHFVFKIIE